MAVPRPLASLVAALAVCAVVPSGARAQSDSLPPAPAGVTIAAPRLGGYLQAREVAQERVGLTTFLHRARLSADGRLPQQFSYRTLVEFQASAGRNAPATVSLREAIVRWSPARFVFTAGEFKTPFTREYLIPVPQLELADLAVVVDSLAPKYDVGVQAEAALGALATFAVGVFNGEGANAIANRDSTVMWVGRATARPWPQLALGGSMTRDGPDSLRWGVDALAQHWGVMVRAEYVTRHVRGRDRGRDDVGWTVIELVRVVPRIRVIARQEDFQRPAHGAARRVRGSAWAVNVDVAPNRVRLLLELSRRISGVRQTRTDQLIAQAQVQF